MAETPGTRRDLPPEAQGNEKWHDTTHAVWKRSSLSREDSEAVVEVAKFEDGFRAVRDGKHPEKGILFFTPAEWEAFVLGAKDGEFDIPEEYLTPEEAAIQRGDVPVTAVVSPHSRAAAQDTAADSAADPAEPGGGPAA
ncbi:DUF397 domain-containing protein [Streptomonospora nanhaiensis]|uniref:DUF397 domain-containing protein n=1 Tax=Streptomonospora nanhaiensis TaxID=1323731 RepID=A0A853BGD5_9ACTN|nr:DUF397 domain-containing protein [Streptomonospora nanhaiensis]MBV2365004.1 DUF397 domain-containing protein [Streptomonospora nanhaiensis]MBX9389085.1 DUF397 domain-containing protein [Streptomonospora nanhaiensis]NYI94538.1 hypothetical protein [Streptomonospora nanhaiensis]